MSLTGVWSGTYVTAKSARNYIDAENIIKDANKIKKELEEIDNLVRDVKKSGSELTREVLLVDDKDMSGNLDETTQFITDTKGNQYAILDEIISRATTFYNEKQEELNRQAQYENQKAAERAKAQANRT
ncbi:MAG: hypothetical protein IJ463_01115 [Bacilli bacterium]|nr:hypothetical protein [Bacilli bacterium]